jgi:hypothetical protein
MLTVTYSENLKQGITAYFQNHPARSGLFRGRGKLIR